MMRVVSTGEVEGQCWTGNQGGYLENGQPFPRTLQMLHNGVRPSSLHIGKHIHRPYTCEYVHRVHTNTYLRTCPLINTHIYTDIHTCIQTAYAHTHLHTRTYREHMHVNMHMNAHAHTGTYTRFPRVVLGPDPHLPAKDIRWVTKLTASSSADEGQVAP